MKCALGTLRGVSALKRIVAILLLLATLLLLYACDERVVNQTQAELTTQKQTASATTTLKTTEKPTTASTQNTTTSQTTKMKTTTTKPTTTKPTTTTTTITTTTTSTPKSVLEGKKIVYDGDSICLGLYGDGGYPQIISEQTGALYVNESCGGGRLRTQSGSGESFHSVVDNLKNLPMDGDIYCFQGGINDWWTYGVLGTYDENDFTGELDTTTVCGALEAIFRYSRENFEGKQICFVITHKIQNTATHTNANGDTFQDYHDAMVGICKKYSIPYYDAFESGLNGADEAMKQAFLTGNLYGTPDGCHPNREGYCRYYVPQLIALFESLIR